MKIKDNDLFQSVFKASLEAILVINEHGNILKINPASETLFGYETEELIGKNIETLIPKRIKTAIKNALKKNKPVTLGKRSNFPGFKKDGSQLYLEIKLKPVKIHARKLIIAFVMNTAKRNIIGTIQDITDVKKANIALFEGDKKYNTLINNLQGIVYRCKNNRNMEMEYITKKCFSITGYTPNEFISHKIHFDQIILEEDRDRVWNKIQKAIDKKKPYTVEYRIKSKDGKIKYVWEQGEGIFDTKKKMMMLEGLITDITKQKRTQAKLKTSETRYKAVLQAIPDLMFVINKKGIYLDVHASDSSQLIKLKEELIGKSIYDALPKDLCGKVMSAFNNAKKYKTPQILEYSITINDELKYFEARIVLKENGNFLIITRNVTDDKHNQIVLKESEERFRLAMLATHDGFYDFNPETNLGWYNQKYIDLFKPTNEKYWWDNNIHPADKKRVLETIDKVIKSKNNFWTSEYKLKSNNKTYLDVEDRGYIIRDKKGKAIRVVGAVADITERKKNEQKLKENEQELRNYTIELEEKVHERTQEVMATVQELVETNLNLEDQVQITKIAETNAVANLTMFSAIAKNFPRGIINVINNDYEILYSEGEGLEIMGINDIPLAGLTIDEIDAFSNERKSRLKQDVKNTLAGKHLSFEIEINNTNFLVNTTPLFNNGNKITRALFVYSDITQQKKIEQDILYALEKEHELNQLKSQFISMASHEFRTPLTAILSSAILIGKQNALGMEEKRKKYIGKIVNNVENLVVILNDFLSLSKLEEGKILANPDYFDIISFSKSVIEEISTAKKEGQGIKLINNHPSVNVYLDPKLMHHILTNLLSNAIKYSPEYKDIILIISNKGEQMSIEVTDEGIGIPEDEQKNMFQRFYRAKNTTNLQGTGLGLNIIKQYTELMDGSVSFKSKLNEGSTFIVELPINKH